MRRLLTRLEDFRLLPIVVVVSMVTGIAVGNVLVWSAMRLAPRLFGVRAVGDAPLAIGAAQP